MKELRRKLVEACKMYYPSDAKGHGLSHVTEVANLAMLMTDNIKLKKLGMIVGYMHDISESIDRRNHHTLGGQFIREAWLGNMKGFEFLHEEINHVDIEYCVKAIEEHRGSYKGEFSSKLSELLSSADRGKMDFDKMVKRSLAFNNGDMNEVTIHMKEKFGSNGYARFPEIYKKYFKNDILKLQELVDNM